MELAQREVSAAYDSAGRVALINVGAARSPDVYSGREATLGISDEVRPVNGLEVKKTIAPPTETEAVAVVDTERELVNRGASTTKKVIVNRSVALGEEYALAA